MMDTVERSGQYSAAADGSGLSESFAEGFVDEKSAAIGRVDTGDTVNRVAVMLGAIVIVALVFLCFRLAYDGFRDSKAVNRVTGRAYLNDDTGASYRGPGAPAGAPATSSAAPIRPVTLAAPAGQNVPMPAAPTVAATGSLRLFASAEDQQRVSKMLSDCRIAFTLSGELSQKWFSAVDAARNPAATMSSGSRAIPVDSAVGQNRGVTEAVSTGTLSAEDWNTIDTQIEAIAFTFGFASRPMDYPDALQDMSETMGREMRVYLQTERVALSAMDGERRSALHARAEAHRQKAGQLLGRLESAVKSGTAPAAGFGDLD